MFTIWTASPVSSATSGKDAVIAHTNTGSVSALPHSTEAVRPAAARARLPARRRRAALTPSGSGAVPARGSRAVVPAGCDTGSPEGESLSLNPSLFSHPSYKGIVRPRFHFRSGSCVLLDVILQTFMAYPLEISAPKGGVEVFL